MHGLYEYFNQKLRNKNGPFTISKYKRFKYSDSEAIVAENQNISARLPFEGLKNKADPKLFDFQNSARIM